MSRDRMDGGEGSAQATCPTAIPARSGRSAFALRAITSKASPELRLERRDLVGEELPRSVCVAKKALKLKISLIFKKLPGKSLDRGLA